MSILSDLYQFYCEAKANKWYHYFAVFCRITLALGFIISGIIKIKGERFASGLPDTNPMGHYLEALHHTEYYYTFLGISQLLIAILLLIPRTALLGALMYFPIILNICILAYAVRFEGTRITTFMLLANVYLLCWDYERLKYILPFKQPQAATPALKAKPGSSKFPFLFFGGVVATLATVVYLNMVIYDIRPGNSPEECVNGCPYNMDPPACADFCDCIYNQGRLFHDCLTAYDRVKEASR